MKPKRILGPTILLSIIGLSIYMSSPAKVEHEYLSEYYLKNIEALSDIETESPSTPVELQCLRPAITSCKAVCTKCFQEYHSVMGFGTAVGVRGTCQCGSTHFTLY